MNYDTHLNNELWIATGGAMLVLFRSILDGTRRSWYALLIGCVLGGAGAAMAGHIYEGSKWVYPICGVAAVMAENIILGLFKASQEFKDQPIKVFAQLWKLVVPFTAIGAKAGAAAAADPEPAAG